jgi:biopolymer transport protein ExbB/TolQ
MIDALTLLSHIFYLISNALLIPVMLSLLFGLIVALFLLGRMLRERIERLSFQKERKELTVRLNTLEPEMVLLSKNGGVLAEAVNLLVNPQQNNSLFISKIVADAETYWQDELEKMQNWIRIGPALGLMGTLIPLGPGLVALADGDLKTLSANLIIAFATTVVGILIGLICGSIHAARKRWYRSDSILLTYTAERFTEQLNKREKNEC